MELPKAYDPKLVEDKIYKKWEKSGYFNPDNLDCDENAASFSIAMPPPNVTGTLHVGHSLTLTYEDLMTRYNRLLGKRALYLPGEDHAAIATQTKVEKILKETENKTRHDLGREKFLKKVEEFAQKSRDRIRFQIRKMGASCDWSRERYTLDEGMTQAVETTFINMYKDGLIYRGDRIVNWCPRCHSTLADDEVTYKTTQGKLWYIKYGPFVIATTRPETKLADTGVAVNPKDERYQDLIGKIIPINLAGQQIKVKVFADPMVDISFGSGAVGVTPAHSKIDYNWALKYGLEIIKLINEDGKITEAGGKYAGLTVEAAREAFVKDLEAAGQIEKIEDYENNLSLCYRCDTPVEPLPSLQWFIDVNKTVSFPDGQSLSIKERAIDEVRSGNIKIIPKRFEATYFQWLENLNDWCISRQIWYGHKIPVYYCDNCQGVYASAEKIKICPDCKSKKIRKDEDTLDTWFSSGLWTFSTLGWPVNQKRDGYGKAPYEDKNDLERFHPTSVMETGYDIIFFWVARMIIMTTYCLGEKPFDTVYLHGLIRTKDGKKMSKSLGNALDPVDMIDKYGADALRLAQTIGATAGNDSRIYEEKIEGNKHLVNKLWNISRFILTTVSEVKKIETAPAPKTLADAWILSLFNTTLVELTNNLDKLEFSAAGEGLRDFSWNEFADWYLEIAKFQMADDLLKQNTEEILLFILERLLIMWHPFIPFVTEEIWSNIESKKLLMVQNWPEVFIRELNTASLSSFDLIKKVIIAIRNLRAENNIEPAKKIKIQILALAKATILENEKDIIIYLSRAESLEFLDKKVELKNTLATVVDDIEIFIPLAGLLDIEKEKKRLKAEIENLEKYILQLKKKLDNKEFIKNAPEDVVAAEKEKLIVALEKSEKLQKQIVNSTG